MKIPNLMIGYKFWSLAIIVLSVIALNLAYLLLY